MTHRALGVFDRTMFDEVRLTEAIDCVRHGGQFWLGAIFRGRGEKCKYLCLRTQAHCKSQVPL